MSARGGGGAPGLTSRRCLARRSVFFGSCGPACVCGGGGGVPGAPGPSGGTGGPYSKAAGGGAVRQGNCSPPTEPPRGCGGGVGET